MKDGKSVRRTLLFNLLKQRVKTDDGRKYAEMTEEERETMKKAFDKECYKRGIK